MMDSLEKLKEVHEKWSEVFPPPRSFKQYLNVADEFECYPKLKQILKSTQPDISTLSASDFDPLFPMVYFSKEDFLWLLPVLLFYTAKEESDEGLAHTVIMKMQEYLISDPSWKQKRIFLSDDLLSSLHSLAIQCVEFAWEDERRINKRSKLCDEIFF